VAGPAEARLRAFELIQQLQAGDPLAAAELAGLLAAAKSSHPRNGGAGSGGRRCRRVSVRLEWDIPRSRRRLGGKHGVGALTAA
jgi:hypothetical protein